MTRYLSLALCVAFLAGLALAGDDAIRGELKKLQGTWQLVSSVNDGKESTEEMVKKVRVVIKDSKHSVFFEDKIAVKDIPFVIDHTKDPKTTTDMLPDGKMIRGIYKLEGDTLTSCVGDVNKERPTEFASKPGSGHTLRVFKRVGP